MHVPILLNSKHRSAEMFIETLIRVPKFDYNVPSCSEDEISVQSDFSQHG